MDAAATLCRTLSERVDRLNEGYAWVCDVLHYLDGWPQDGQPDCTTDPGWAAAYRCVREIEQGMALELQQLSAELRDLEETVYRA